MDIRPIRNQADYDAAVAEIERLWNADPGTDDGDKLDILATGRDDLFQQSLLVRKVRIEGTGRDAGRCSQAVNPNPIEAVCSQSPCPGPQDGFLGPRLPVGALFTPGVTGGQ